MTRLLAVSLVVMLVAPAGAQNGNSAWTAWARANHHPIASVQQFEGDTFADLQFFKTVLRDRRIVQLDATVHDLGALPATLSRDEVRAWIAPLATPPTREALLPPLKR